MKKLKIWGRVLRAAFRISPMSIPLTTLNALMQDLIPYVGVYLSAAVLDGLAAGESFADLLRVALPLTALTFLLSLIRGGVGALADTSIGNAGRTFEILVSEKNLRMDYPMLESPAANALRARIDHDNTWGSGFFTLYWQFPNLISAIGSMIVALALLFHRVPLALMTRSLPMCAYLLAVFVLLIARNLYKDGYVAKRLHGKMEEYEQTGKSHAFYTYGEGLTHGNGKDIRVFHAQPLIEGYLDAEAVPGGLVRRAVCALYGKLGFADGLTGGLLLGASYLCALLAALEGALPVGSVLLIAGALWGFSGALSSALSLASQVDVTMNRQIGTLEYEKLENPMYKGTLAVEKRNDCDYEIEFRDVSFRYPGSEAYALRHVSFRLTPGKRMAVVGMNGSGKTTMIKLLARLYDPTEGEITLNRIDIRKYDPEEYRSLFSVVFQDFALMALPLGENVAANTDVDRARAENCLRLTGFGDRLDALPKGLDTPLYQDYEADGVEISGGEAQKIALARAIYKDAPFIVLDEPTAALDPRAEYDVYAHFGEISRGRTAIYISHRLSSCRFCDEIMVFEKGEIAQRGAHETLLRDEKGVYARLWGAQAQYYDDSKPDTIPQ